MSDLPEFISLSKFLAARAREISTMKKCVLAGNPSQNTKLIFQKLPTHMRRRAMSHNPKRLPKKLRDIHKRQMAKSGAVEVKPKRPSRKYRRRTNDLKMEFNRRQKRVNWLNTHIWHAKRFHMTERWGFRLPHRPCDRSFRACYRASKDHVLLQDISYFVCLQLCGDFNHIIDKFKLITECVGRPIWTLGAKAFQNGKKEGKITIGNFNQKSKIIGDICFMWRPVDEEGDLRTKRKLWLWVHSAYLKQTCDCLIQLFNLEFKNSDSQQETYVNLNEGLELRNLGTELSRFRLTGARSLSLLHAVLKPAEEALANQFLVNYDSFYMEQLLNKNKSSFDLFNKAQFVCDISPYAVISLIAEDPRFHWPEKRSKTMDHSSNQNYNGIIQPSELVSDTLLWLDDIRQSVNNSVLSNAEINKKRQCLLVPGTELAEKGAPVPLIVVQQPGSRNTQFLGYSSGFDVIIPSAWARPIWLSFIMWGAKAGGLRDAKSINFIAGNQPFLSPDTEAGCLEEERISQKLRNLYFRKPPNKRTNFIKLSIASPFNWNWHLLLTEWAEYPLPNQQVTILRNSNILKTLQKLINGDKSEDSKLLKSISEYTLIPVRLTTLQRGLIKQLAVICLPLEEDSTNSPPEEKLKNDPNERKRRKMRINHKRVLKRLKQRRKRNKTKGTPVNLKDKEILLKYQTEMRQLWLPKAEKIRPSCCREVMGFVKEGDFNFVKARGCANGYIAIGAFLQLINLQKRDLVLIRNTNSRKYIFAKLDIICN